MAASTATTSGTPVQASRIEPGSPIADSNSTNTGEASFLAISAATASPAASSQQELVADADDDDVDIHLRSMVSVRKSAPSARCRGYWSRIDFWHRHCDVPVAGEAVNSPRPARPFRARWRPGSARSAARSSPTESGCRITDLVAVVQQAAGRLADAVSYACAGRTSTNGRAGRSYSAMMRSASSIA